MAEPGQKLKELKDTIRKANIKPTTAQKELYFELSEEIERRGESYLQKLEELYNPKGDSNEYRQNNSNKIQGKKIAKAGKKKYLKYFNSELVSDFLVSKTFDYKSKKKYLRSFA